MKESPQMGPLTAVYASIVAFGLFASLSAAQYEVSGKVDVTHGRFPDFNQQFDFRVSVSNSNWNTRLTPTVYKTSSGITPDYWEAGSDGLNFFALSSIESYAAKAKPKPGVVSISAFACQGPGNVPFAFDRCTLAVWFAYASHDYLKNQSEWRVVPPEVFTSRVLMTNNFTVPAFWELEPVPPHLPKHLTTSNYFFQDVATVLTVFSPLNSTTNFSLKVREFQDISGLRLPKSTTATYNLIIPTTKVGKFEARPDYRVVMTGLAFTTNLSVGSFVPRLPAQSSLEDYSRLTNSPPQVTSAIRDRWFDVPEIEKRDNILRQRPNVLTN